jgi:hypothetical protein
MRRLEAEDSEAARQLWDRYFQRLVGLARSKLESAPRRAADEEIAAKLGCAPISVERKLAGIRSIWAAEVRR